MITNSNFINTNKRDNYFISGWQNPQDSYFNTVNNSLLPSTQSLLNQAENIKLENLIKSSRVDSGSIDNIFNKLGTFTKDKLLPKAEFFLNNMPFTTLYNSDAPAASSKGMQTTLAALDTTNSMLEKNVPYYGLINKASNILTNIVGNTDGMTKQDVILSKIPGLNFLNAIGGKSSNTLYKDTDTFSQVGAGYTSTEKTVDDALQKSNKKYGLFSRGKLNSANRQINRAETEQDYAMNIADSSYNDFMSQAAMTNIFSNKQQFYSQGAYNNRTQVGQKGLKFPSKDLIQKAKNLAKELKITLSKTPFEEWVKTVPEDRISKNYDLKKAYEVLPLEELEAWRTSSEKDLKAGKNHLRSVYELPNGDYEFLKLGKEFQNPEVIKETSTYYNGTNRLIGTHDLVFEPSKNRYYYKLKKSQFFKEGGKMNVIPEGALHARLHHMDTKNITKKGIPVVITDNEGNIEQSAEIEKNEIIFNLEVTQKLEKLWKENTDESAIEAGKLLVKEILENTIDNTGLLNEIK